MSSSYNSTQVKDKQTQDEEPEVRKVRPISGKVTIKKPNAFNRLMRNIFSDDGESVKTYIIQEVLIPSVKKAISDIMANGTDIILYGESKRNKSSGNGSNPRISYSSYSNYYSSNQTNQNRTTPSYKEENREIIFESRGEAEDVLIQLNEIIERYHMVSMSDLNDILNVTGPYTDQKYGWTDLSTATTSKVREGYALRLPRVRALN